jgi:CHAD domain-containing protein
MAIDRSFEPDEEAYGDASEVALALVARLVAALGEAEDRLRADQPDSVHAMRTTARRLRSVLASSRGIFDRHLTTDIRERLGELGTVLGVARDLEVRAAGSAHMLDALPATLADGDSRERLITTVSREYARARVRALAYLRSTECVHLLFMLDEFSEFPPLAAEAQSEARKTWRTMLHKETKRLLARTSGQEAETAGAGELSVVSADELDRLHSVRKAARRLRYTAEALQLDAPGLVGVSLEPLALAAERVQNALGKHRDNLLLADQLLIDKRAARAAGETTAVYDVLRDTSQREAESALADLNPALSEIRRLKDLR